MNMKHFSEPYYVRCGVTIGPDQPTSYNGLYSLDDHFPTKNGKGST
jgi:hypothetical protein